MAIITNDPDLLVAVPAINAAQTAAANTNVSTSELSDLQTLSSSLQTAINALGVVMTAKQQSTATNDVIVYLYAAGLRGLMASALATIGTFTGANAQATVNPNGLNAYQLVVRYTGDINNLSDFMNANGLSDPFNIGSKPLIIPTGIIPATT